MNQHQQQLNQSVHLQRGKLAGAVNSMDCDAATLQLGEGKLNNFFIFASFELFHFLF